MARIIWTDPALQDLDQIADYISLDNPSAARKLVKKVFNGVEGLAKFPELGPRPHDLPDSRYRCLSVRPLRIFYRIEKDVVFVVYVMRAEKLLRIKDIESQDL